MRKHLSLYQVHSAPPGRNNKSQQRMRKRMRGDNLQTRAQLKRSSFVLFTVVRGTTLPVLIPKLSCVISSAGAGEGHDHAEVRLFPHI